MGRWVCKCIKRCTIEMDIGDFYSKHEVEDEAAYECQEIFRNPWKRIECTCEKVSEP